jgi:hypothetical protein
MRLRTTRACLWGIANSAVVGQWSLALDSLNCWRRYVTGSHLACSVEGSAMSSGAYFWPCVELLVSAFDGSRYDEDENLKYYEQQALGFSKGKRSELRHQLVRAIGGLARLETRLAEHDDDS